MHLFWNKHVKWVSTIHSSSNKLRQLRRSWSALARGTTTLHRWSCHWPFHESPIVRWSTISVGTFITCLFGTPTQVHFTGQRDCGAFCFISAIEGIGGWDAAKHVNWKLKPEWMANQRRMEKIHFEDKGQMVTAMTNGVGYDGSILLLASEGRLVGLPMTG